MDLSQILSVLKVVTLAAVFFVWFIRYDNIVKEFENYGYSSKLRDLVGILKIASVILIQNSEPFLVKVGSGALVLLMLAALITHLKIKNPPIEMAPSATLMVFSILFFVNS